MGSTSPERPQPVWCPGPFIPGRDWTRASRGVGLQQFCRAQISLSAQSEPLAGRDICCLTFLIYTSPPSRTNIQFCSPPFQTSPSPSITERAKGGKRKKKKKSPGNAQRERGEARHAWRSLENFADAARSSWSGMFISTIHFMFSGSEKGEEQESYTSPSPPSICASLHTSPGTKTCSCASSHMFSETRA